MNLSIRGEGMGGIEGVNGRKTSEIVASLNPKVLDDRYGEVPKATECCLCRVVDGFLKKINFLS
ncbi:MAG: hypothetical protein ACYDHX_17445 [Methanothrix sp.]